MPMMHSDTGLHQHTGRWPAAVQCLTAFRRNRGMDEGQPILTKPHQDPGDVVGFSTATGESQRFRGSSGVGTYRRLGDSV